MSIPWTPLVALVVTLVPLLWVKCWITHSLQELGGRWVGDADVALILYFVLLLPGIVVHELSHGLTAFLLGVRVRRISIGPVRRRGSQRVSLGSVQVGNVDPVRASLIGLAPLLVGSVVILLIGTFVLGMGDLAEAVATGGFDGSLAALAQVVRVPDFWLWLYLIFAVSNAMLPSPSDMDTVRPVLIFLGLVTAVVLLAGWIPAVPEEVVRAVNAIAGFLASAFGMTLAADVVFVLIIWLLLWLTRRLQGA